MASYSEVIGEMLGRSDADTELINTIMKTKDLLMVSAAIVDEVFSGENKFKAMERNRMALTVYDIIKEEDAGQAELNNLLVNDSVLYVEDVLEDEEDF